MIRSMTGFGRSQITELGYCVAVEIRSVNSRYAEIGIRLPRPMANLEARAVERVQQRISRGKVSVSVSLESAADRQGGGIQEVVPNVPLAEDYLKAIRVLKDHFGFDDEVNLDTLLRGSDIITVKDVEFDDDLARRLLDDGLGAALDELDEMRVREGGALAADFAERLQALDGLLGAVKERAPIRVAEAKQKLTERISQLLNTDVVDEQRLAMEVAILSDRSDVTEECVRFHSHLDQFRTLMDEDAAGRKLNFLLQEMNREVNTVGSKSNDATIAHLVVQMKDEIERLREQVQNVE